MIFLRKFLAVSLCILAGIMSFGCGNYDFQAVDIEEATEETTESTGEEQEKKVYEAEPAEGVYVYDGAEVIDKAGEEECNKYMQKLYEDYLINTAVVTVDFLDGKSPESYATEAYEKIYSGKGSGILFLINNDTNKDYIYRSGSCISSISDSEQQSALYFATRDIVEGDYGSAVMKVMELGEKCPKFVFDNGNILSPEQKMQVEEYLSSLEQKFSLLVTENTSEISDEELCTEYYKRKYGKEKGCMILADAGDMKITVHAEKLPENIEDIKLSAEEFMKSGDYFSAVQTITDAFFNL